MKRLLLTGLGVGLLGMAVGAGTRSAAQAGGDTGAEGVHSIQLPVIATDLPEAPGRESVAGCALCHSPRYILNQPPLSRKQWTAEVDKMRKTFGAPIPESQVPTIIDYLVAVRGSEKSK